jgi:hypothetical protein
MTLAQNVLTAPRYSPDDHKNQDWVKCAQKEQTHCDKSEDAQCVVCGTGMVPMNGR